MGSDRALLTEAYLKKTVACSPLLPTPGDKVVREMATECLRLQAENARLREALETIQRNSDDDCAASVARKALLQDREGHTGRAEPSPVRA
jgi:hypothetical protein